MNILCSLGFHNWGRWKMIQVQIIDHIIDMQKRNCENCGKIQRVEL